ncbi:MAG: FAD-binding protein, partial [Bacteroidetes bacterium]|nr:FAD-binding protein [Bacteroidota bacterium]
MDTRPHTIVVGAGVIGLTSAIRLQEAGFPVRIVTRDRPA